MWLSIIENWRATKWSIIKTHVTRNHLFVKIDEKFRFEMKQNGLLLFIIIISENFFLNFDTLLVIIY